MLHPLNLTPPALLRVHERVITLTPLAYFTTNLPQNAFSPSQIPLRARARDHSRCALAFFSHNCFAHFSSHHTFALPYPHTLTNRYVASLPRSWHHPENAQHPIFKNCSSVASGSACDSRAAVSRLDRSEVAVFVPSVKEPDSPAAVNGCAPVATVSKLSKPRSERRLLSVL